MIQVFQVGTETKNSFGDQEFVVSIDDECITYTFSEGEHVNIEVFINKLRREANS